MSHHYIRHNYGDNCCFPDTSFKRYNRYNDSHGDTLIFNYNNGGCCGGGYGICAGNTFLSGLGAGLASGFMGLFSGFMCGFGNLFGFGGMGMMGMPMFGMGGLWNSSYLGATSGTSDSSSGSTSKTSHSDSCTDADETNAHTMINKFKSLQAEENPSADELRKLYKQAKSYYENPLDDAHKKGNKDTYGLLINSIENFAKEKNIDLNKESESTVETEKTDKKKTPSEETEKTPQQKSAEAISKLNVENPNQEDIAAAKALLPTLSGEDKTKLEQAIKAAEEKTKTQEKNAANEELTKKTAEIKAKSDEEVKAMPTSKRIDLIDNLKDKTDEDSKAARIKLKKSFYTEGNENVQMSDFEDDTKRSQIEQAFINIIDTSKITDIKGVTNTTISKGADGKYKLECKYKGKPLTYGYVEEKDGEIIFHGMQMKGDTQHYVLQKKSNGKYELVQYDYHKGHGTADYTK